MSPRSLRFLVETGFDFNRLALAGIPYQSSSQEKSLSNSQTTNQSDDVTNHNALIRSIMEEIMTASKPVVVHNGFLDLMFIYQAFFANLPDELSIFIADLSAMFKGGLYDTKYTADYVTREKATFLAYLFRK